MYKVGHNRMRYNAEMHQSHHNSTRRLGTGMVIAMWVLLLVLLTIAFNHWLAGERNPNQSPRVASRDGIVEVVLQRNRGGHYMATGEINGQPVEFMLDTGASDISVPARLAERLGLKRGAKMVYQTAAGPVVQFATQIDRVALGPIELSAVRASINPHSDDGVVLLGMSFLKHLEFVQRGDTLTLRKPHIPRL
jgi:aspartyl protease family protein